jgi:hypothetical protein
MSNRDSKIRYVLLSVLSLAASVCMLVISMKSYFDLRFIGIFTSRDTAYHLIDLDRDVYQGECKDVWQLVGGLGENYVKFSSDVDAAVIGVSHSVFFLMVISFILVFLSVVFVSKAKKMK